MTREEIKKQWELEFGAKYEDCQRANVYTAVDILDFAERVVNKLLIPRVVGQSEQLPCGDLMKHNFSLSKIGRCITCDRAKEKAR